MIKVNSFQTTFLDLSNKSENIELTMRKERDKIEENKKCFIIEILGHSVISMTNILE